MRAYFFEKPASSGEGHFWQIAIPSEKGDRLDSSRCERFKAPSSAGEAGQIWLKPPPSHPPAVLLLLPIALLEAT